MRLVVDHIHFAVLVLVAVLAPYVARFVLLLETEHSIVPATENETMTLVLICRKRSALIFNMAITIGMAVYDGNIFEFLKV